MKQKLAIVTVTINHHVLKDFLNSLKKQTNQNYHLFLVDISSDKKPITIEGVNMTVISSENHGYAYGVNRGFEKALEEKYEKFCIINDDTFFDADFVSSILISLTKHPKSIITGKIYYAPGYEYHKERYDKDDRGNVLWYAGGTVDWRHATTKHQGVDEIDKRQYDMSKSTSFISGCLMSYDKSVFKTLGYWDESFFLYFEDADYCERAKINGIQLYYDPSIKIWHKISQSTGGSGSLLHVRYQRKNRLRFGLKYAPFRTKLHLIKNYLFDFLK